MEPTQPRKAYVNIPAKPAPPPFLDHHQQQPTHGVASGPEIVRRPHYENIPEYDFDLEAHKTATLKPLPSSK